MRTANLTTHTRLPAGAEAGNGATGAEPAGSCQTTYRQAHREEERQNGANVTYKMLLHHDAVVHLSLDEEQAGGVEKQLRPTARGGCVCIIH